ncbi:hypothetical protein O3M35_009694 [Rhynocoris fuscipes]|uniref:Uncharacterized protein n=1 Tax=Rhynocoris fuscipes TaxID=488301 RepID=A0AAW1D6L4_9HEMI
MESTTTTNEPIITTNISSDTTPSKNVNEEEEEIKDDDKLQQPIETTNNNDDEQASNKPKRLTDLKNLRFMQKPLVCLFVNLLEWNVGLDESSNDDGLGSIRLGGFIPVDHRPSPPYSSPRFTWDGS